jgi:hypothetical protein
MRNVVGFAVLSLSLMACIVEPGPEPEPAVDTAMSALTEESSRSSDSAEASSSCSALWECELCRDGTTRNVLYEICDDGSLTRVLVGECARACL